jgi:small subunit ribosomal protein S17
MEKKNKQTSESKQNYSVGTRGREFEGHVVKKINNRVVIEFERTIFVHKYERFYKKRTRIHARLPEFLSQVKVGDYVSVRECRPLSKLIHHIVIKLIKEAGK